MTVTFDDARRRVQIHLAAKWSDQLGTLTTLPEGFEDATHWRVVAGAREALVDGDDDYQLMDAPALLVDKRTGAVTEVSVLDHLDQLDRMRPTVS
jgi:hypothetical protein